MSVNIHQQIHHVFNLFYLYMIFFVFSMNMKLLFSQNLWSYCGVTNFTQLSVLAGPTVVKMSIEKFNLSLLESNEPPEIKYQGWEYTFLLSLW